MEYLYKCLHEPSVLLFPAISVSVAYLSIVIFLLWGLLRLKPSRAPARLTYSVVIAARNEEDFIDNCLRHVFSQTISSERFEVILALDRCTDNTAERARNAALAAACLFRIIEIDSVPPGVSPKKHALTKAIDFAKNDVITITDADCTVPSTWLETIDCNFGSEVNMLQGVTSYKKTHPVNHWLFNLQAVDFASHAIVSAAGIGAGVPINSNANNLSFRRNGFIEMGGYGDKAGVVSGDDDMLLQRFNRKNPGSVKYMTDAKGAVTTVPTATFGGVFEQRKRWGSKTVHYEPQQVLLLGTVFLFYLVTAAYAVFACFEPSIWRCFLILFGVKFLGECVLMLPGMKILGFKGLMQYLIPASIIQLPVVLAAVLLGVFGKFKWKDAVYRRTV